MSCDCGVAVREGDDVIVVDMCRDNIPRARFASTVEPQKGTTLERNNNGKSFLVSTTTSSSFVSHYGRSCKAEKVVKVFRSYM